MDQGIIETTRKLYRKALMQRMRTAYDAIANCFAHAGFFRTVLSDPDDAQPDDDRTGSNLHEAFHKIAGHEVEDDFETFALADAAAPVVAPAGRERVNPWLHERVNADPSA
ncbi:hypothetical protein HPB48_018806 [Haemaphysalis longicornis]|uniref:Uncharacterized protein n=1 Tax=Haemaphysalis longicornis TaxID=44386 RepID=A0A9J6H0M3_HAELO|nr:hypothetical protein HPB48_018806 [Haemaphysalis longicornis]